MMSTNSNTPPLINQQSGLLSIKTLHLHHHSLETHTLQSSLATLCLSTVAKMTTTTNWRMCGSLTWHRKVGRRLNIRWKMSSRWVGVDRLVSCYRGRCLCLVVYWKLLRNLMILSLTTSNQKPSQCCTPTATPTPTTTLASKRPPSIWPPTTTAPRPPEERVAPAPLWKSTMPPPLQSKKLPVSKIKNSSNLPHRPKKNPKASVHPLQYPCTTRSSLRMLTRALTSTITLWRKGRMLITHLSWINQWSARGRISSDWSGVRNLLLGMGILLMLMHRGTCTYLEEIDTTCPLMIFTWLNSHYDEY